MRKNYYPLGILILLATFFGACKKYDNVELANYDAEFAIPLFQTNFSMQDVLSRFDENTYINIDSDGLIRLNYKGDITSRSSSDIFDYISQNEGLFPLLDTVTVLPFDTNAGGFDLDYAILKSGTVQVGYQSDHQEPMTVVVTVPNLLDPEGNPFQYVKHHATPVGLYIAQKIDLTNYVLKPTDDSIHVEYYAYLENSARRDTLKFIGVTLEGFAASYVEGYLGQEVYEIPRDTIRIDFFDNWTRGEVYFEDPKIRITVINSFGFPIRSKASVMDVHTADGRVLPLESIYLDSINVDFPTLDEVGEIRYTDFYFDKNNSNIDVILGANPVELDYEIKGLANPDLDTSIRGFLIDTSQFRVQVEVELPVYGKALGFAARDTVEINLGENEDIQTAEFKLVADNGLPLEIGLQGYFLDEYGAVLDSLIDGSQTLIAAAPVDDNGEVIQRTEKVTFIPVNAQRFAHIRSANRLVINATFSTYNHGETSVKVYHDQDLKIRMGMKALVKR